MERPARRNSYLIILALLSIYFQGDASAQTINSCADAYAAVNKALTIFESKCGFPIMRPRLPMELDCGSGYETVGTVWDRFLVEAGFPSSLQEREDLAAKLDLASNVSLAIAGMARPEAIELMLKELRKCQ